MEETKFDPWGAVLSGATQSKFLYTGQEHDTETGLHYYDARYYDPELRRFTQPDTIIPDVYNPQTLNRYAYALNNPLKYTDPTGHFSITNLFNSAVKAVTSAAKTVSSAISNAIKPKAPSNAPVSTAKLPNNPVFQQPIVKSSSSSGGGHNNGGGGSSSINVLGNSSNQTVYSTGGEHTVSIEISRGIGTVSANSGVKIDQNGHAQYGSLGSGFIGGKVNKLKLGSPIGGSMIISEGSIKHSSWNTNPTVTLSLIGAVQFSIDPKDNFKVKFEGAGFGCCGVDITLAEYTGILTPNANPGEAAAVNYKSTDLKEFYGR